MSTSPTPAYAIPKGADAVLLRLHVQPRAARTEVVGVHGDALKVRLACPPVDGRANRELLRFLSEILDRPVSSLELVGGKTSRRKSVLVSGLSAARALALLSSP
jgi:uncharacterized protein (TIGR00251 family)